VSSIKTSALIIIGHLLLDVKQVSLHDLSDMDKLLHNKENHPDDPLSVLQKEIAELEAELKEVKDKLAPFEKEIHRRLDNEIDRVRELTILYKKQKAAKKAKRMEQKKRGKNYKESKEIKVKNIPKEETSTLNSEEQREKKRLYKEAVVQVHPDKISPTGEEDIIRQANLLTAQLNDIYRNGDLEELINFYQYIILENDAQGLESSKTVQAVDPKIRLISLKKKKETLTEQLNQLKNSYTYNVLETYDNPFTFIDELYVQFQEKIKQLEKRTRQG
jgi:hypothetical protein